MATAESHQTTTPTSRRAWALPPWHWRPPAQQNITSPTRLKRRRHIADGVVDEAAEEAAHTAVTNTRLPAHGAAPKAVAEACQPWPRLRWAQPLQLASSITTAKSPRVATAAGRAASRRSAAQLKSVALPQLPVLLPRCGRIIKRRRRGKSPVSDRVAVALVTMWAITTDVGPWIVSAAARAAAGAGHKPDPSVVRIMGLIPS